MRALHIVPRWDVITHDIDYHGGCVCGPTDTTEPGDACTTWSHHSLDGREQRESSVWWRRWRRLTRRPLGWQCVGLSMTDGDPWLDRIAAP